MESTIQLTNTEQHFLKQVCKTFKIPLKCEAPIESVHEIIQLHYENTGKQPKDDLYSTTPNVIFTGYSRNELPELITDATLEIKTTFMSGITEFPKLHPLDIKKNNKKIIKKQTQTIKTLLLSDIEMFKRKMKLLASMAAIRLKNKYIRINLAICPKGEYALIGVEVSMNKTPADIFAQNAHVNGLNEWCGLIVISSSHTLNLTNIDFKEDVIALVLSTNNHDSDKFEHLIFIICNLVNQERAVNQICEHIS